MDSMANETVAPYVMDYPNVTSYIVTELINCAIQNITGCDDNVSAVTSNTKPTLRASSCDEGPGFYRWLGDVVILPPIILFGIIGNILSFTVFCLQKSNMTTTILLCFLAVVDTMLLVAAIPLRFLRQVQLCHDVLDGYNDIYTYYIFRYGFPSLYVLRTAATWTTTLLTVDRHIGICRPLHAQRIVTIKLAVWQIVGVVIGSIIINLPGFFEFHFINVGEHVQFAYRPFAQTNKYIFLYKILTVFLVMYVIPICIMVIFNCKLVLCLRKAAKDRELLQRSVSGENMRLNRSITTIVIVVVVTFMVCNIMPVVSHTLWSLEKLADDLDEYLDTPRRYSSQISNIFVTINSAVNFLIYCVCCRSFRRTFIQKLCCWFTKKVPSQRTNGRLSSGSANTYVSLLENGGQKSMKMIERQDKSIKGKRPMGGSNNKGGKHEKYVKGERNDLIGQRESQQF